MKKKYKRILFVVVILFIISLSSIFVLSKNQSRKILTKEEKIKELINISDLSDEFMENYFDDYAEMTKEDNLENVLIVISENGIKNNYGATNIVKAPNNQYFLQYKTKKDRKEALKKLKSDNRYVSVEENEIITFTEETSISDNDSFSQYNSWGIEAMGLDYAIEESNKLDLPEVTVAIIDTGLDVDLFNKNYPNKLAGTYNSTNASSNISDVDDTFGHGTHIAGTIAEGTPNNVNVLPIKGGSSSVNSITAINALNYISYNENADVVNMSFGANIDLGTSFYQAVESAKQKNIISVAAAGNNNNSKSHYPSSYDNTISIGAVDLKKEKAVFSNYGTDIDFVAPGVDIKSINKTASGTSVASPHVVCTVAIIKGFNKSIDFNDTKDVLKTTTEDLGDYGWDPYYGNGFINFKNKEFCDGTQCDKYNVFKSDEINITNVTKIEAPETYIPSYNYGNITNLMSAKINVYYSDTEYVTKTLGVLDDIDISSYDAYSNDVQNITIRYKDNETTLAVDNKNYNTSGWEYEKIDDSNIKITKFLSEENSPVKIYIPNTIDNYNVVSLGDNLFENNNFVNSIIIPESVTNIGNSTFKNANVKTIDLKASNISVGDYAFYGLKDLKSINSTINSLGKYSFANCYSLDNIKLIDDLKEISAYAFSNDHVLENINIPSSLTNIGEYAFSGTKISNVIIPNNIIEIKEGTFKDCYNLSTIKIPNGVEKIGEYAFQKTILQSLNIPASVKSISSTSFSDIALLLTIIVDKGNSFYRSENNTLIEKLNNKLVVGNFANKEYNLAIIPSSVKIIGERAFAGKTSSYTQTITIPSGVEKIESNAFEGLKISKLTIPKSVKGFDQEALNYYKCTEILVYYNSPAMKFIESIDDIYKTIDPYEVVVNLNKTEYNAFDMVDITNLSIVASYQDKNKGETPKVRKETYKSKYTINYNGENDSFRYGDDHFTISVTNANGYKIVKDVPITVSKLKPTYEVPSDITANWWQKLSEVKLPDGFEWMDGNEILEEKGDFIHKARYIPEDTVNYEIVEDIDIRVFVINSKEELVPTISLKDKTYDGTDNIDIKDVVVTGLDNSEYEVVNVNTSDSDVGTATVTIKLKLTEEKYKDYSFDNGKQEKKFTINFKIVPKKIVKPTTDDSSYVYNGSEIPFDIIDYDKNAMNVVNNKGIDAGEYETVISLKNNNYIWDDGTTDDIILTFKIAKAQIYVHDTSKDVVVKYDGNVHMVDMNIEYNADSHLKYMDGNGNYTLDDVPKYSDVGTYVIKYKLYSDNNHTEYFGERTLKITTNTITNNTKDYEGFYDEKEHSIDLNIEPSDYSIKYSINNINYDLDELPKFKDVGEYTVNYKITKDGYEDLTGSNKVKIYGIRKLGAGISLKNDILITDNNKFVDVINNIDTYSKVTEFFHYDKDKKLIDSVIKTGDFIDVNINGSKSYLYKLSFLGDVNGDGKVSSADYIKIRKHIMETEIIEDNLYFYAADMNNDGKISSADYIAVRKAIMKGEE